MRMHATDDNGERFLRFIVCDECGTRLGPNPEICGSGWTKGGQLYTTGGRVPGSDWDRCPECS